MNFGNIASSVASMPQVQQFLKDVVFPASKQTIINKAQEKGADKNIISMLQKLPDKQYQSASDVTNQLNMSK